MRKLVIAGTCLLLASTNLAAEGSAAAGKEKSAVCAACHGANGVAIAPTYPNLAGQNAEYMVAQLMAFKSGERKGASSALMAPMAMTLSDQDMLDLAAFYNSLEPAK
jgi:cytochrome c553